MEGDPIAQEIVEFTGELLGRHLADAVALLSPEAIFFYGGVSGAGDVLLAPTRRALEENVLGVFEGHTQLLPSALQGRSAAILGAAALAWKTFCVAGWGELRGDFPSPTYSTIDKCPDVHGPPWFLWIHLLTRHPTAQFASCRSIDSGHKRKPSHPRKHPPSEPSPAKVRFGCKR